jgi:molybdopterin molybdotransferase/putative molybdopterin biosynthesis protein
MEFDHISRRDALEKLFALYKPEPRPEDCPLDEAVGRITFSDVLSINNQPVIRASKMDGIAVHSSDFAKDKMPDTKHFRLNVDYVRADTGDDFDDAYDSVVLIEDVTFLPESEGFELAEGVRIFPGNNVIPKGADIAEGDLLIGAGRRLRPIDISVIARGAHSMVSVVRRPVVAFIPTGSELVPIGTYPKRGEIIDSNSLLAKLMLSEMGADVITLPIVRDITRDIDAALSDALSFADIVLINGGSSKGKDDLSFRLIEERGELICHGVLAAPGRAVGIGVIDAKPVINVPGPMVGCYFVFDWCLREVIAAALGTAPIRPRTITAELTEDLHTPPDLEFQNRLHLKKDSQGKFTASPLELNREPGKPYILGADSGQFVNAFGVSLYPKGSLIEVELLSAPESLW